ncbi:hypothetical protein LWC33_10550 [Pseudonocardia sp. RS11V-5]|uniref:hypothetical protein n=1 Tax=Pseudonocardia terrae TaxID=2905831 RepID=UPI001E5282BB|nr:hypothetical protein [Pseudonocardia terrae]MCE3551896.1 hypothetical protein [Pseudonocardia terrae]
MRLGRKLAEGVAVDREAERLAETREPASQAHDTVPVVTAALAEDTPAERPARV